MKKILFLLFSCIALLQIKAQQYKGNWDAYVVQINHKPASVVVDLDFGNSPEAKEKRNVIIVQLNMKRVQPDGMPAGNEIKTLDSIENGLVNSLSSALSAQYTGRYTRDGKRDFYFYSNDTSNCITHVATVLQHFSTYTWTVLVNRDDDLSNYLNVLYPTQKEMERIQNRRMVDALHAKGDQLTAPRKVDHFLFFKTEADRKKFAGVVQDNGFTVENAGKEIGVKDRPYSLHISRTDKVDYNSIDKVSLYLWELALHYFGKYEGWETFVVGGI
ncbi:DUF695 domain-containing protein [Agriterribacter sp.]|uniref:DUF695 domain-containing protein n=1 Tax=Agriterribacter sp. TaxID=2821509 RepID=UPI002C542EC0|nr:DUF695 domain-containing protein [Agriterribacter sp.]HRO47773.1 DUF695 domain-containing protein [Agriterribacter sp.]HRQ17994.1 DUF695 domain-containing protein [Agriterribacter sp.]